METCEKKESKATIFPFLLSQKWIFNCPYCIYCQREQFKFLYPTDEELKMPLPKYILMDNSKAWQALQGWWVLFAQSRVPVLGPAIFQCAWAPIPGGSQG